MNFLFYRFNCYYPECSLQSSISMVGKIPSLMTSNVLFFFYHYGSTIRFEVTFSSFKLPRTSYFFPILYANLPHRLLYSLFWKESDIFISIHGLTVLSVLRVNSINKPDSHLYIVCLLIFGKFSVHSVYRPILFV